MKCLELHWTARGGWGTKKVRQTNAPFLPGVLDSSRSRHRLQLVRHWLRHCQGADNARGPCQLARSDEWANRFSRRVRMLHNRAVLRTARRSGQLTEGARAPQLALRRVNVRGARHERRTSMLLRSSN